MESEEDDTNESPLEVVQKPVNCSTTHLFVDLCSSTFLAGKPIEGVLVLVVQQPIRVQRLSLVWKGFEYVSWFEGIRGEKNVTGTEWWLARRLFVFPDDGTAGGDKIFVPGTYTFPFTTLLRSDLPGSYEEKNVQALSSHIHISTGGASINTLDRSCIRYSITGQCDLIMPNNHIGKITSTKNFNVVENFDVQILYEQAAVRKAQNEFFFRGPMTGLLWVANKGNILSGEALHLRVDILNKSPYSVEKVILSIWEHITIKGTFQNQAKTLKISNVIQEVVINQSETPAGTQKTKTVKVPLNINNPSVTKGKLIIVSYELIARYVYTMNFLELKVPFRILGNCDQVRTELPEPVPINLHNVRAQELHSKQYEPIETAYSWEGTYTTY